MWCGQGEAVQPTWAFHANDADDAIVTAADNLTAPRTGFKGGGHALSTHSLGNLVGGLLPHATGARCGEGYRGNPAVLCHHVEHPRAGLPHFHLHLGVLRQRQGNRAQVQHTIRDITEVKLIDVHAVTIKRACLPIDRIVRNGHWVSRTSVGLLLNSLRSCRFCRSIGVGGAGRSGLLGFVDKRGSLFLLLDGCFFALLFLAKWPQCHDEPRFNYCCYWSLRRRQSATECC